MKVFISGGTGSIGAHLIKMLSDQGTIIHALVRSKDKAKHILFDGVQLFEGDILNPSSIERAMQGCNKVYHLAAFAKVWSKDTGDFYSYNVQGTVNILESALLNQIEKIVITSTAGVYGPSINGVVTENKIRDIDLFNEYEGSKAMAESVIKDYIIQHNMNVVIVSPTRVYGPFIFGKPSSVTLMIDKYVNGKWRIYPGTGKELGNYIFIKDAALGHLLAMEKGKKGSTYLLGGENHDYVSFYKLLSEVSEIHRTMLSIPLWTQMLFSRSQLFLAKIIGKEPVITPKWVSKAKYNWEVSPNKAQSELGLPITPLKEGLKETVLWLRQINNSSHKSSKL